MQKHPHLLVLYCHQFVCRVTFRWLIYGCEQGVRVSLFPRATLPHPSAPQRFAAWQRKRNGLLQGARATVGVGQNPYRNPTATFLAAPTRQACSSLGACSIVAHQRRNAVRRRVQEGVPSLSCEFGSPELILMARYCQRPEGLLHCRPFGGVWGGMVLEENPYWDMVLNIVLFRILGPLAVLES